MQSPEIREQPLPSSCSDGLTPCVSTSASGTVALRSPVRRNRQLRQQNVRTMQVGAKDEDNAKDGRLNIARTPTIPTLATTSICIRNHPAHHTASSEDGGFGFRQVGRYLQTGACASPPCRSALRTGGASPRSHEKHCREVPNRCVSRKCIAKRQLCLCTGFCL